MGVSAKGSGSKPRLPVQGDITVCMSCAAVLKYDANLHVSAITDPKLTKELTTHPMIRRVQREILDMRARNPRPN
jgi:hypothetical protein